MSRMISDASGKEGGKQCLKPAALPENRKHIKHHACNTFPAMRLGTAQLSPFSVNAWSPFAWIRLNSSPPSMLSDTHS